MYRYYFQFSSRKAVVLTLYYTTWWKQKQTPIIFGYRYNELCMTWNREPFFSLTSVFVLNIHLNKHQPNHDMPEEAVILAAIF